VLLPARQRGYRRSLGALIIGKHLGALLSAFFPAFPSALHGSWILLGALVWRQRFGRFANGLLENTEGCLGNVWS